MTCWFTISKFLITRECNYHLSVQLGMHTEETVGRRFTKIQLRKIICT